MDLSFARDLVVLISKLEFEIRVTVIKIDESLNDFDLFKRFIF